MRAVLSKYRTGFGWCATRKQRAAATQRKGNGGPACRDLMGHFEYRPGFPHSSSGP
jgi:hypothetical protein